jgi:predicted transcriptional regulator
MRTISRRDKMKIYGDVLSAIKAETRKGEVVLTRIQLKTNVPFDRLKAYLSDLEELGLVQDGSLLRLTEKGQQYVVEYERVLDFMKRMGLCYR